MIQRDHHADGRPIRGRGIFDGFEDGHGVCGFVRIERGWLWWLGRRGGFGAVREDGCAGRGRGGGRLKGDGRGRRSAEAPEVVHACDCAHEVAVGHVGEGRKVSLGAGGRGDAAAGADPLVGSFGLNIGGVTCRMGFKLNSPILWKCGGLDGAIDDMVRGGSE